LLGQNQISVFLIFLGQIYFSSIFPKNSKNIIR
jgi:hypothetical protein